MHLFLFVVLLASFVHRSTPTTPKPEDSEVFVNLKDGFPDGTLLTVYLKYVQPATPNPNILITLTDGGDCLSYEGQEIRRCLRFYLKGNYDGTRNHGFILSAMQKKKLTVPNTEEIGQIWQPLSLDYLDDHDWWRFDLYKISDKLYLPFYQGFNAEVRTDMDSSTMNITSVRVQTPNIAQMNFDKDNVYVSVKHGGNDPMIKRAPELVMAAFDRAKVVANRVHGAPPTQTVKLNKGIPEGKKIRLSALMMANRKFDNIGNSHEDEYEKNWSTIDFVSEAGNWGFSILNVFNIPRGNTVQLHLYAFDPSKNEEINTNLVNGRKRLLNAYGKEMQTEFKFGSFTPVGADVTDEHKGKKISATSTDLLHLKLWRPKGTNIIKIRVYYMNGKVEGNTIEIDVGLRYNKYLDKPMKIETRHSATILHMSMV